MNAWRSANWGNTLECPAFSLEYLSLLSNYSFYTRENVLYDMKLLSIIEAIKLWKEIWIKNDIISKESFICQFADCVPGVFCRQTLLLFGHLVYGPVIQYVLSFGYIYLDSCWINSWNKLFWFFQIKPPSWK